MEVVTNQDYGNDKVGLDKEKFIYDNSIMDSHFHVINAFDLSKERNNVLDSISGDMVVVKKHSNGLHYHVKPK